MANAVAVQAQDISWKQAAMWCFTKFVYNASTEVVTVPVGTIGAAVIVDSGTAPTTTITAGAGTDLVQLTGGTVGKLVTLITKHAGNPANVR